MPRRSLPLAYPVAMQCRRSSATVVLPMSVAMLAFSGCVSTPQDPSQNRPVAPSVTAERRDPPSAAEIKPEPPPEIVQVTPVEAQRPLPRPAQILPPEPLADHGAARIELTQLSRSNRRGAARQSLDLRLDAFGSDGAPARAAGEIRVVVEADGAEPAFAAYDIPMSTRAEEARHYDDVLGQYVLRVAPAWSKPPRDGTELRVTVTIRPRVGEALETRGVVRW